MIYLLEKVDKKEKENNNHLQLSRSVSPKGLAAKKIFK
jgi:hypothetical protein